VTHLRKIMLEELQARKITALVLGWVEDSALRSHSRGFGVADHSRGALLLGLFGDGWAPFFVTNSLVQDQRYEPTLSQNLLPGRCHGRSRGFESCRPRHSFEWFTKTPERLDTETMAQSIRLLKL